MKYKQTKKAQEQKEYYKARASSLKKSTSSRPNSKEEHQPITAMYIGRDSNVGFQRGRIYKIHTRIDQRCLWVYDHSGKCYPYSKLETFLQNWKIVE